MKKNKSQLDEMQEQKLLKIEHYGCWFAFWGLFAAILIQSFIGGENVKQNITGEGIVFFLLGLYLLTASIKNGIWDRKYKPNLKTNLVFSAAAGIVVAIFHFIRSYMKYHKMAGSIATGIFMFIGTFVLCIIVLSVTSMIFKKRKEKLEGSDEEA